MPYRIDELAQKVGTTSRNVRAYQARGLLPPPRLQGRTGYYDEDHRRRLEIIGELQERGFSLEAIKHTLDVWSRGGDLAQLIGFQNVLLAPLIDEEPQHYTLEDLTERFPETAQRPEVVQEAVELGLLELDMDGRLLARSPLLIDAGAELARVGVPMSAIFELVAAIRTDVRDIAERFVGIIDDHLITPFMQGQGDDVGPEPVLDAVRRLKPIALEVVRPFLADALQAAIERAVQQYGETLSDRPGRSDRPA
jgi:DNA-binding transcriptional MerR regulator